MTIYNNTKGLAKNTSRLFEPLVVRGLQEGSAGGVALYETQDGTVTNDSSLGLSSSFKYDSVGAGLKSTQQLNIDWSDFANHTFFNSAQVKTNVAFEKILNEYPFDGTQQKVEIFLDRLTGFERYVYDLFPKHTDYLFFSGSTVGEATGGTYITTRDLAGAAYPNSSTNHTGESLLSPGFKSMTLEFQVYVPTISSSYQALVDKHTGTTTTDRQGFFVGVEATGSVSSATLSFVAMSGSLSDTVSIEVAKGQWNHVAWVWDRTSSQNKVFGYLNQELVSESDSPVEFGEVFAREADLLIGSGSNVPGLFSVQTTFSGALDEFRLWHSIRTPYQRKNFEKKSVFASPDLKLYYRFNEPPDASSNIVIDYSSNSLHGKLAASAMLLDVRGVDKDLVAGDSPMLYEKHEYSPILFPDNADIFDLQNELLTLAEAYDKVNPNLITRLVPPHYLQEGQISDGLYTQQGAIVESPTMGSEPRGATIGGTQTLLLLLYTWAKFFDEVKLYIQSLSTLDYVDYDLSDTVPDEFLQAMASRHGFTLPPLFQGSSIEQFVNAENIGVSTGTNSMTLRTVQNQIWRRVLINMQDFMKSKGTLHSVKSFIRSVGIDPDNTFRIREFGGPSRKSLSYTRDTKTETASMLNFVSGGIVTTPWLTSSIARSEPGWPYVSNINSNDQSLTSGSFTLEGTYRFPTSLESGAQQSLMRLHLAQPGLTGASDLVALNVVATKGSGVSLYSRNTNTGDALVLSITSSADVFDGSPWYVSCGRQRCDDPSLVSNQGTQLTSLNIGQNVSSSFFLRVAKSEHGDVAETYSTSSFYFETASGNLFESLISATGSLPYMAIGSGSLVNTSGAVNPVLTALNYTGSQVPDSARVTSFTGKVAQIRFWSKALADNEWKEHVRNYRSVGIQDPKVNFNFDTTNSGSWERLRIDCSTDQIVTDSSGLGVISLTDFTQNELHMVGTGFPVSAQVVVPQSFRFSYLSPKFDEASTTDKVRVRSFESYDKVQETPWAQQAPLNDIPRTELPMDNERFTIDFSVVDALNQDIMTIFSTLDEIDNAIGKPELAFSGDYPDLDNLRKIYFNKLTDQLNVKGFFEFFKWFDTNIGTFVSQLLPRKTKFLGSNYIIESHVLERPKVEYHFEDTYLGDSNRNSLKDTILLQLITGFFSR